MKLAAGVLMGAGLAIAILPPLQAQTDCLNYIVVSDTATPICLDPAPDPVIAPAAPQAVPELPPVPPATSLSEQDDRLSNGAYSAYLERLKTCQPSQTTVPYPALPSVSMRLDIQGVEGDRCRVSMTMVNPEAGTAVPYATCRYSPTTITWLTDGQGYAAAEVLNTGNGRIDAAPASAQDAALSTALAQECEG